MWPCTMIQADSGDVCRRTSDMVYCAVAVFMKGVDVLFFSVPCALSDVSRCFCRAIHPPGWLPGCVGCSNNRPISPLCGRHAFIFTRNQQLFIIPMRFQMSFSGWVFMASSQARTAISLAPSRSSTSTSTDQKHQHQYLPYLVGLSGWSSEHTCHVSPPSRVTSTRVTFRPPPE
uniref:Uncharacterized protein n=1 Tax=Arundo donax TaxID=35708 RepID=A0A0A9GTR8_ARUDO